MAASTRHICGCPSSLLFKAAGNLRCYLQCSKRLSTTSLSKVFFLCVESPVATVRERFPVTSIGQRGWSAVHSKTRAYVKFSQQTPRTVCHSSGCTGPSSDFSLGRHLLSWKHDLWLRCTAVHCRILCLERSPHQSESETSAILKRHALKFSTSSCVHMGEDLSDRMACKNGRPEKKENIKTIPNLLTTLRMASAPLLGYMVLCESFGLALAVFTFAGISDLLDGYIARNFPNQTSALGSALDPLADKLLVTILTVTLTSVGLIPLLLTGLIVFRDASLIAGGFYIRYKSLPPPITLSRYFDISHATVSLAPTLISKVNTGLQLSLVAFSLAAPVFGFVDHLALQTLWWSTGATTFLSGADYLRSWKKYVTLLEKDQKEL